VPTRASSNAVSGLRPLEAPVWLRRGFHWTGPGHPRPWRASRHQHLNFTGFTNVDGLIVNGGSPNQAVARVGGRLLRPFEMEDGKFVTPYMELNLLQGFADASSINVSGFDFGTGQYGTAMQARGGATGMLNAHFAVFGDVAWQHQVTSNGFQGWAFNGGFRHDF
jgi:outer membrane autotransporter protein